MVSTYRHQSPDEALFAAAAKGDLVGMRRACHRGIGDRFIPYAFLVASKNQQLDAMHLLHDEWGATNIVEALQWAAENDQLDAMHLLHDEWGASFPKGKTVESTCDSQKGRRLLAQWAKPIVKSVLKT